MHKLRLAAPFLGAMAVLIVSVVAASGAFPNDNAWPYASTGRAPVLAAVGDISCQPGGPVEAEPQSDVCDQTGAGSLTRWQAQTATANQIEGLKPDLVALLGDEQYQVGRYEDFLGSFDKTFGAFKFLQRPSPGNHEFYDRTGKETGDKGEGYFDYYNGFQLNPNGAPITDSFTVKYGPQTGSNFTQPRPRPNGQAGSFGATGDGWYSYDLGSWHIISLNVECDVQPGGCTAGGAWVSSETQWLSQDLQSHHASCTLVYWHQPSFATSPVAPAANTGDSAEGQVALQAWWPLLYQHGVDVVLNGHDHIYARYSPMDPTGKVDTKKGIREFIVGTGGESLDAIGNTTNVEKSTAAYYGVMALTLEQNGYDWNYASAMKSPTADPSLPPTFSDTGSDRCHGGGENRGDH